MSFIGELREELRRSPLATICAPLGVLVGLGGMMVGYLQLEAATRTAQVSDVGATSDAGILARDAPNGSIALIVIGVFFALTPSFASMARILYKLNKFAAVPCSILLATMSIFLNRLNAMILGYGVSAKPNSTALDNLLFYGTVLIFLAVAGRAPLIDLARPTAPTVKTERTANEEALGTLAFVAIAILIWCGLVGWSQRQMTNAFLS